jgi:hypothetical protein
MKNTKSPTNHAWFFCSLTKKKKTTKKKNDYISAVANMVAMMWNRNWGTKVKLFTMHDANLFIRNTGAHLTLNVTCTRTLPSRTYNQCVHSSPTFQAGRLGWVEFCPCTLRTFQPKRHQHFKLVCLSSSAILYPAASAWIHRYVVFVDRTGQLQLRNSDNWQSHVYKPTQQQCLTHILICSSSLQANCHDFTVLTPLPLEI